MKLALLVFEGVLIAAGFASIMLMPSTWGPWAFRGGIAAMSAGCVGMILTWKFLP